MSNAIDIKILEAYTCKQESPFQGFCRQPIYTFPRILYDIKNIIVCVLMTGETIQSTVFFASNSIPFGNPTEKKVWKGE